MLGPLVLIGFFCAGLASVVLAVVHEVQWWKRRRWLRVSGKVVEIEKRMGGSHYPRIEYEIDGRKHTFTSEYGEGHKASMAVGDEVKILASPDGKKAEHFTAGNRLLFTVIPLVFGALFILVALTAELDDC